MADLVIRQMELTDIDSVVDVEKASFATPWSEDIFYQEVTKNQFAHYFVIQVDGIIIGYAGLWVVIDDAQITNIAIMPSYRGHRLGEKLFEFTMKQAIRLGSSRLSLEVRVTNVIAQRMYRKFGLVPGGLRKNYYTDNKEDAIVMWVNL
ncbi:ribosomal-protein-alanine N-acetyltransferase [Virgibacillus phasianinus]|uniref:[Ribosomal protein bS18]-alanine N-acetyltransferase n=1 Tax=Virgibacillus phasianinus TaxID=2017483 RepID=A0A220TZH9_9BACI|nr:ribosomal protein S18-alanine N-acetyltransferase [Virgibacillus phasianinus]ASK61238.1 ribosomal-protein-alanine N-acetyltransferase [Virgibacillus phasianinus]